MAPAARAGNSEVHNTLPADDLVAMNSVLTMFEWAPHTISAAPSRHGLVRLASATDRCKTSTRGMLMDALQMRVHFPIPPQRHVRTPGR